MTDLRSGFSLALGGGGARGYAHLGVAEALAERGLTPARIVGTSMGSVVGAGMAAGLTVAQMSAMAAHVNPWRDARFPARLGALDHRPLIEKVVREVGDPWIEDLLIPYAAATYDLVSGRQELVTSGRVYDALLRSCALPAVFVPVVSGGAVWCDAGLWEPVPVSMTRRLSSDPVVGVSVIPPKPVWLTDGPIARSLRFGARLLATDETAGRLGARRYTALLAERITLPVAGGRPDVLIVPNLRGVSWLRFGEVALPRRRGYEAAAAVLDRLPAPRPSSAEEVPAG